MGYYLLKCFSYLDKTYFQDVLNSMYEYFHTMLYQVESQALVIVLRMTKHCIQPLLKQ